LSVQQERFDSRLRDQWPPFLATSRAVPPAVGPLRRALTTWAAGAGANPRAEQAIALASSEAITNAVVHAYRDAPRAGTVCVAAERISDARMRVTVTDEGGGMVPRSDSPGLGLGLALIVELAASVDIGSTASGTCVAIEFDLLSD
jgi:serine/threonine-protein kinase RsbW